MKLTKGLAFLLAIFSVNFIWITSCTNYHSTHARNSSRLADAAEKAQQRKNLKPEELFKQWDETYNKPSNGASNTTTPQQQSPEVQSSNTKFYSSDPVIVLQGPSPDGGKARILIPNGKGFESATLKEMNSDEPLKVSVNIWLNKICETGSVKFVDESFKVTPFINSRGNYDMFESDLKKVNNEIKTNGLSYTISSTEKGLSCSK